MAAEITGLSGLVGVLVPGAWCHPDALWPVQSSYSQAGPRPGVPEPQQATDLVLESSGTMAASTQLRVRVMRAGDPRRDDGAGIVWEGEGDALWRGWDPPRLITGWEALSYSTTTPLHRNTHCCKLKNGTVVLTYQKTDAGLEKVYTRYKTLSGAWSSETLVYTQPSTATHALYPCLVATPDGGALLMHWIEDSASTEAQIRVHRTTNGTSWSVAAQYALQTTVDISGSPGAGASGYDIGRLRCGYAGGQFLLIAQMRSHDNTPPGNREIYKQFASVNGVSFDLVETGTTGSTDIFGFQEVLGLDTTFLVIYAGGADPQNISEKALESAYQPLSDVAVIIVDDGYDHFDWHVTNHVYNGGDLAACVDEDGTIYLLFSGPTGALGAPGSYSGSARSIDDGLTWASMGSSTVGGGAFGLWWSDGGLLNTYPKDYSVCVQGGRAVVPHRWVGNPGTYDDSLAVAYLGGWSTVTMPGQQTFEISTKRAGWETTWLPYDLPDDVGWTAASAATYSATLESPGRLNLTTSGGTGFIHYSETPPGTIAEGIVTRQVFAVNSGGSLGANQVGLILRLADGTDDYEVAIRATTTGFRCYDSNGAAAIGADVTVDVSGGVEILAALDDGNFSCWYRVRDQQSDKEWIAGPTSTTVTNDNATPNANSMIRFGVLIAADVTAYWYESHYVSDEYTGPSGLAAGQTNPDDLFPRPLTGRPVYVDGGTYVRGIAGPGRRSDEFDLNTRYDYAIDRVFPVIEPSPRRGYRSIGVGSAVQVALTVDGTLLGTVDSNPESDLIGFYLDGINWRAGEIEGYTAAGWASIVNLDTASDMLTLGWTRVGNVIVPAAGGSQTPYLHANEFAGGWFQLAAGTIRKIARHSGGSWRTTGQQTPRLELEGITGAEAASGTTGAIWPQRLLVVHNAAGTNYSGYRLVADAQTTADGYLAIGTFAVGPIYATTPPGAGGIAWSRASGQSIATARDGTSRGRIERPSWRTLTMAWPDPVWEGPVQGESPTPDWIEAYTGSGGEGVATPGDALRTYEGVLSLLDAAAQPVVACTRIPIGSTRTVVLNRREDFLYGWFRGPVARRYVHEITGGRSVLASGVSLTFEEQT